MSCIVKGCNSHWKMKELSFHSFPKSDYEDWLDALRISRNQFQWRKNNRVCSLHFEAHCFDRTGQTVRLKPGSVPTLHLPVDEDSSDSTETAGSIDTVISTGSAKQAPVEVEPQASTSKDTESDWTLMPCPSVSSGSPKVVSSSFSSSLKSSSSEGTKQRRKRFISIIHNYSCSPNKYKRKYVATQGQLAKYRKQLYSHRKRVEKLKMKVQSLKQVIQDLTKNRLISERASEHLENLTDGIPKLLFNRIFKNKKLESLSREQYPPELRQFAMTLQFYSTKAYNYVRETLGLALPNPSTIRQWYSGIDCSPGFTKSAFDVLSAKVKEHEKKGFPLVCSCMLDEMAIRKHIDMEGGKTWGYIDVGSEVFSDSLTPATEALVFMVVAHNGSWKLPIAYFLIKSLSGEEKANLIRECLSRLYDTGVKITSVTCDGPSTHFTMMKFLGCRIEDCDNLMSYFVHPADDASIVFCIFDICHMLKLMRNCLATLKAFYDPEGNLIQWKFIELLFQLQEKEMLSLGTKLRKAHMEWQKQKMKVKLAGQTLSNSVADALDFLTHDLKLPEFQGSAATIKFIRRIDKLFDVLNSRTPRAHGLKGPLRKITENEWRPFLMESVDYLKNCKDVCGQPMCKTQRKTPFIGFMVSSLSVMGIFDEYVERQQLLNYILTYKCSQDHLEMFFCSIRSRNGWNNNPSALQFKNAYKRLLFHSEVKGVGGNCEALDATNILSINAFKNVKRSGMPGFDIDYTLAAKYRMDVYMSVDHDYNMEYSPSLSEFAHNVVSYISGYVIKMTLKYIKCPDCALALYGDRGSSADDVSLKLLQRKDKGGLIWPSEGVRVVCAKTEVTLRRMLKETNNKVPREEHYVETLVNIISRQFYELNLFPVLENHFLEMDFETNHVYLLIKTICYCYIKIRLFNLCKSQTQEVRGASIRQQFNKLILFHHQ